MQQTNKKVWSTYQYNRGKLKLIKDLKNGQANLRHSLIDIQQIENMSKIYDERKEYYLIKSKQTNAHEIKQEQSPEQQNNYLSHKEKIQLIRKKNQNNKLKDKYNNLFAKQQHKRYKIRNPVIFKMLETFKQKYKQQISYSVSDELKLSQQQLSMIKINSNRKVSYNQSQNQQTKISRPKFISMETGLPEKQRQTFPNFIDYVQGRFIKNQNKFTGINISGLQTTMNNFFLTENQLKKKESVKVAASLFRQSSTNGKEKQIIKDNWMADSNESNINMKSSEHNQDLKQADIKCDKCSQPKQKQQDHKHLKEINNQVHQKQFIKERQKTKTKINRFKEQQQYLKNKKNMRNSSQASNQKRHSTSYNLQQSNTSEKNYSHQHNPNRTFTKSQHYSKQVIATMSNFYESRKNKKNEYTKMIQFLKYDRPLTSQIRRRNYKVIGQRHMQDVKEYRSLSEVQRVHYRKINYEFYLELLRQVEKYSIEDIPISIKILDKIKSLLESNYLLQIHETSKIVEQMKREGSDCLTNYILKQFLQFVKTHSS